MKTCWEKTFLVRIMVVSIPLIALNCQAAGLREWIAKRRVGNLEEFRTEFVNKHYQGYDVSEAERLFRQAKQAREARDRRKSNRLFKEAFVALENAKKLPADVLAERQPRISQTVLEKEVRLFLDKGGGPDWSAKNVIVYQFVDDSGNFQVATIRPDGSDRQCLTCRDIPDGPRKDRHKGDAHWHPSGDFIVLCAEMRNHFKDSDPIGRTSAMPGRSWWNNLWITTADGTKWYRLTDYSSTRKVEGAFYPHFSHDGKKLFWAKLYKRADKINPLGHHQLFIADFVFDDNGVPHLENITNITPKQNKIYEFFEPLGFSPNGKKVLFVSNMQEEYPFSFNLWRMDLKTGEIENLTKTDGQWNEHASYSPDGRKILWMSTIGQPFHPLFALSTLRTELFLMDTDGKNIVQVTHFNTPGHPEYSPKKSIAGGSTWSPDGKKILVSRNWGAKDMGTIPKINMWMITLN